MASQSVPIEMLFHPELLATEQLLEVLLARHVKLLDIEKMSREQLLEVFHRFCIPHAQRVYRDSGRGKLLNRNRGTADYEPTKLNILASSFSMQNEKIISKNRLRPPPDQLSCHMKKIKLNNGLSNPKCPDSYGQKRKIACMDSVTQESNQILNGEKKRKIITWP